MLQLGIAQGGVVPRAAWQNFPTDLVHFLNYFVAHEAHHRGAVVHAGAPDGAAATGARYGRPLAMVEASARMKLTLTKRLELTSAAWRDGAALAAQPWCSTGHTVSERMAILKQYLGGR